MFDNSKIDHSGLASGGPTINYDTTNLEKEGFKSNVNVNVKYHE